MKEKIKRGPKPKPADELIIAIPVYGKAKHKQVIQEKCQQLIKKHKLS